MEATIDKVKEAIQLLKENNQISNNIYKQGQLLYMNGQSQLLTQSKDQFEILVDDKYNDFKISLKINGSVEGHCECKSQDWCHHKIAGLMELGEVLSVTEEAIKTDGKVYTREGMTERVLEERREKARKAEYKIQFADNIYGEHELTNEKGQKYRLMFRNFNKKQGYCSCPDFRTNKLGTCKHLIFAFNQGKSNKYLGKYSHVYPFVEIYLNPLLDYKISWFYEGEVKEKVSNLLNEYFDEYQTLKNDNLIGLTEFLKKAELHKIIKVRPEVIEAIGKGFDKMIVDKIQDTSVLDYSVMNAELFPYQKEGVAFATYREGAIIADEMGLGKTIQAIGTALMKKQLFQFNKTLIICPASLKDQWKREIEKFTIEKATVVNGTSEEREGIYKTCPDYFLIVNYETILRDFQVINQCNIDFIILDEAQRIKNYTTVTANAIKSLKKKHALVITGTPIENKLIDLYSIVEFLDPYMLSPLWEFSYQHCYFDHQQKNKIVGYYNLSNLKERLKKILIRREKPDVIKQLPYINHIDIPVEMHHKQRAFHANYAKGIAAILRKKFKTPYDMQRLMLLLTNMRMVCDSTFLVDQETNVSPKLIELEYVLLEKLDMLNKKDKVIIFSEWKRMNNLIAKMLRNNNIGFVQLSGDVPVKKRANLIKEFEDNDSCKVFISTEAGGVGLNLQAASTVINFELPWNPAKKNQRIGRIDRIGQKNDNLTVINFITKDSIEMKIVTGLVVKQSLFDGVLSDKTILDMVDLSDSGRAQFLKDLEQAMEGFTSGSITFEDDQTEEIDHAVVSQEQTYLDLFNEDEINESSFVTERNSYIEPNPTDALEAVSKSNDMQEVMTQGMGFLSGLFKMATGKDMNMEGQSIHVDEKTGEVTMKFKIPVGFS